MILHITLNLLTFDSETFKSPYYLCFCLLKRFCIFTPHFIVFNHLAPFYKEMIIPSLFFFVALNSFKKIYK